MKSGRNRVLFSGGAIAIAAIYGLNEMVALALARLRSRPSSSRQASRSSQAHD